MDTPQTNNRTVSAPESAMRGEPGRPIAERASLEEVQRRSGYQSLQPVERPPYWGVDLDWSRRPGVPMLRNPMPFANTRYPPEPQKGIPSVPLHGRPNKEMPPVFGTAVPLRGLSGALRKWAYRYPDHEPRYWLIKLFADRVDAWEFRVKKALPFALPLAALGLAGGQAIRRKARVGAPGY